MEITLTTPALLFPAVSLLLLAYTNRFLTLAGLIRTLHDRYQSHPDEMIMEQIQNLRKRVKLIQQMQTVGVTSLFLCVLCMFILFAGYLLIGEIIFGISLILLMTSLALSLQEIRISVNALNLQLSDLEGGRKNV
jgi:cobalamin biosynthesis protein CobD/CbiB